MDYDYTLYISAVSLCHALATLIAQNMFAHVV